MLKSKALHVSLGGVIGAAAILVALQFAPCSADLRQFWKYQFLFIRSNIRSVPK
jgi:hypothetical protein